MRSKYHPVDLEIVEIFGTWGGLSLVMIVIAGLIALRLPVRHSNPPPQKQKHPKRLGRPGRKGHWFFSLAHVQFIFIMLTLVNSKVLAIYGGLYHDVYVGDMFETSVAQAVEISVCLLLGWAVAKRHKVEPVQISWLSIACILLILSDAFLHWSTL